MEIDSVVEPFHCMEVARILQTGLSRLSNWRIRLCMDHKNNWQLLLEDISWRFCVLRHDLSHVPDCISVWLISSSSQFLCSPSVLYSVAPQCRRGVSSISRVVYDAVPVVLLLSGTLLWTYAVLNSNGYREGSAGCRARVQCDYGLADSSGV